MAIIDPHIKKVDKYSVNKEMIDGGFAVFDKKHDSAYEGQCWPGTSNWVDCFNPDALKWWKQQFVKNELFAIPNLHLWNDMNEPSVFNGPEITMPKDSLHYDNWEHRDVHNLYGLTFHQATYLAMVERLGKGKEQRPFVLTRAFFGGIAEETANIGASEGHSCDSLVERLGKGKEQRPFVLTRAFFAGSQRSAASWTGDN